MRTVTVAAAVMIEDRKVLLSRRKAGSHLEGLWEFPGGKVEAGEDPRDALRRELTEELGVRATVGEIVEVTFHRYEDDDKAVLLLFFEAAREPGSPEPAAIDVAEVGWFGKDGLDPSAFPPADVAVLAKVAARIA
jgi:8-oxo-dGTP diphosphatase